MDSLSNYIPWLVSVQNIHINLSRQVLPFTWNCTKLNSQLDLSSLKHLKYSLEGVFGPKAVASLGLDEIQINLLKDLANLRSADEILEVYKTAINHIKKSVDLSLP